LRAAGFRLTLACLSPYEFIGVEQHDLLAFEQVVGQHDDQAEDGDGNHREPDATENGGDHHEQHQPQSAPLAGPLELCGGLGLADDMPTLLAQSGQFLAQQSPSIHGRGRAYCFARRRDSGPGGGGCAQIAATGLACRFGFVNHCATVRAWFVDAHSIPATLYQYLGVA
jgi:hypothetical protein